jgi:hypothetical protein
MAKRKAKPTVRGASRTTMPRKPTAKRKSKAADESAAQRIDRRIRDLADWRGETLARMRKLILEADPAMHVEVKWRKPSSPAGVPVWSHDGIVCTGETYKEVVKLTFAKGAQLPDPARLFNASLEGNTRRAIDLREGEKIDARVFKALVKAAVAANGSSVKKSEPSASKSTATNEPFRAHNAVRLGTTQRDLLSSSQCPKTGKRIARAPSSLPCSCQRLATTSCKDL